MRKKRFAKESFGLSPGWCLVWGNVDTSLSEYSFSIPGRLGVVDAQPSFSPSRKVVVIGDVWLINRDQLLNNLGVDLRGWTGTDQDVVALAWERWGVDSVKQFVGIFGLVVWEQERDYLWLIRDRVGGKTLYYCQMGSKYYVAPRLKSLASYHTKQLDLVALRNYLCMAFVPGERTLWEDVKELRPGTLLSLPAGRLQTYWEPVEQIIEEDKPLEWHSHKLRALLNQVIQDYLPQDNPVGVYLSGGLDSSSVTALAAQFHQFPVHTYSIFFGDECPNELEFSSLVAQFCQTNHHILEITPQQMWTQLPDTMANLDDPIGDPLTVPNYLIAKLAKQDVDVILNGEGGDPCFGGPKNQPMLLNQLYHQSSLISAYLASFQKCFWDLPRLFKADILSVVDSESFPFEAELGSSASYLNRLMSINIKFKGADQILTKVNNLTQAEGLEGRSPLFDQRVVQLAMEIPPHYKLAGAEEKAVLKEAVRDILPLEIIKRPKSGMMVPVQLGFKKYWQREARHLLLDKNAILASYCHQDLIRDWLKYQGDPWNRYGVKLWLLTSLEIWLQVHQ